MKKLILISSFYLIVNKTYSQINLVPNGSFENYTACPGNTGEIFKVTGWDTSLNSPDYFNICSSSSVVAVPNNNCGYQIPFEGSGYCGFIGYFSSGLYREIFTSQLVSQMNIGQKYYISLRVNLANDPSFSYCGIDKMGILFSTKLYNLSNPAPINNFAHVYTNSIVTDTMSWTLIKGVFIADSNYKFINIGNFYNNANTNITLINSFSSISYYFVDDVRVSTDSLFGLSLNIKNLDLAESVNIYPNPSDGKISIKASYNQSIEEILAINSYGDVVFQEGNLYQVAKIDLSHLKNGIYNLIIKEKGKIYQAKIIIQK